MMTFRSDALVFFGVTGDHAHKKIFPALYAMAKRGALTVPVIGVGRSPWSLARLRTRVMDGIKRSGGIDNQRALQRLLSLLRYVEGRGVRLYSRPVSSKTTKTKRRMPPTPEGA